MKIIKSTRSDKIVIKNMMQLYLHDLSPFTDDVPNENGLFSLDDYFDCYWEDSDRFPYIFMNGKQAIGFALVRQHADNSYSIAEFFILKSFRKQGFATEFAHDIFRLHSGRWSVSELVSNKPAQTFWRKAISAYTDNQFEEKWSDSQPRGPMQIFKSSV